MPRALVVRYGGIALATTGLWLMWSPGQRGPLTMEKTPGVLLVDDKFGQDAPEIVAKVKTVPDKPIRYILNTHQHGHHTAGKEARARYLGRGHTNGDSAILFPSERALHTGDLYVGAPVHRIFERRAACWSGTRR